MVPEVRRSPPRIVKTEAVGVIHRARVGLRAVLHRGRSKGRVVVTIFEIYPGLGLPLKAQHLPLAVMA
eukprot:3501731-Alexandrium_andersonii.AAC.1